MAIDLHWSQLKENTSTANDLSKLIFFVKQLLNRKRKPRTNNFITTKNILGQPLVTNN
jgi:hypothetical protein